MDANLWRLWNNNVLNVAHEFSSKVVMAMPPITNYFFFSMVIYLIQQESLNTFWEYILSFILKIHYFVAKYVMLYLGQFLPW